MSEPPSPEKKRAASFASTSDVKPSSSTTSLANGGPLAEPRPTPTLTDVLFRRRKLQPPDPDAVATLPSVYDDPVIAKHYAPRPDYENLHRFDPGARWTFREEKVLHLHH